MQSRKDRRRVIRMNQPHVPANDMTLADQTTILDISRVAPFSKCVTYRKARLTSARKNTAQYHACIFRSCHWLPTGT